MNDRLEKHFCVIGDPIGHSLSPQIHETVFRTFNLDFTYTAISVPSEDLAAFVKESKENGRPGFNVTIPHKQSIIPLLDEVDSLSLRIGAVNTVINKNGKLYGYNTDVKGAVFSLSNAGWKPKGLCVLLGAGGAARAAIEALAILGTKSLYVSDLLSERLFEFQRHFQELHQNMHIIVATKDSHNFTYFIEKADLLINATPVGMWPKSDETPVDPNQFPVTTTVFDMVPKPIETKLLRKAKARGMKTIPGVQMLIAQALESDALYLNRAIPSHLFKIIESDLHNLLEGKCQILEY